MNLKTLEDLKQAASDYAADCADFKARSSEVNFIPGGMISFPAGDGLVNGAGVGLKLNDWAFNQAAQRLDAPPADWLRNDKHCPDGLRVDILNRLGRERKDMPWLVRAKGTACRAVLSQQFKPYDNVGFVDSVAAAVETLGMKAVVARAEVADELRAYVVVPGVEFVKDPGAHTFIQNPDGNGNGGIHPAIYISNSERGGLSVTVAGALWRSICTNGAVVGLHQGETVFKMAHRVAANTMQAFVNEALVDAFQMSEDAAQRFLASQDVKVEVPSLKPLVQGWAAKYGITVEATDNWLAAVMPEAMANGRKPDDPRMFDVINAATWVAQGRNPGEREQLEILAGDMLLTVAPRQAVALER